MKSIELAWDDALRLATEYQPPIRASFPQYLDEMCGLADGAGVAVDAVLLMNAMEEVVTRTSHHIGCTSVAVGPARTAGDRTLVAHNEDWLYQDTGRAYLVHAEPAGEPPFLSMTYGGFVPAVGFNAHGIAQCCDSVDHDDDQPGIPRMLIARAILGVRSLDEAIQIGTLPGRAAGYSHLLADADGRMCNLELSAADHDVLWAEDEVLVHANCYLSPIMSRHAAASGEAIARSLDRVEHGLDLLRGQARVIGDCEAIPGAEAIASARRLDVEDVAAVLASHFEPRRSGICCHEGELQGQPRKAQTLAAVVMDLDNWVMWAAAGNPCRATFYAHGLKPCRVEDGEEEAA